MINSFGLKQFVKCAQNIAAHENEAIDARRPVLGLVGSGVPRQDDCLGAGGFELFCGLFSKGLVLLIAGTNHSDVRFILGKGCCSGSSIGKPVIVGGLETACLKEVQRVGCSANKIRGFSHIGEEYLG